MIGMRHFVVVCVMIIMGATSAAAHPRIAPTSESAWTVEQRDLAAIYGRGGVSSELRTFLTYPAFVRGVMPFANYIMDETTLTPRHRELLILRTAWLCHSKFLWAKHVPRAAAAGLSAREIARVARGADALDWNPFEATLLRMADEVHVASFVSTPTWQTLAARYGREQLMDAAFTVSEVIMLATITNSLAVEPDDGLSGRLPAGRRAPAAGLRHHVPLSAARVPALKPSELTPALRTMLDPSASGSPVLGVYRTLAQHPRLYAPRQLQSEYIRTRTTITGRQREMAILRIAYLCGAAYPWSAHAPAGRRAGLSEREILQLATPGYAGWRGHDAAIVRAVDEMYASDSISDATWAALTGEFNRDQMLDFMVAAGGYRVVSEVINTFGVQLEPSHEGLPTNGDSQVRPLPLGTGR